MWGIMLLLVTLIVAVAFAQQQQWVRDGETLIFLMLGYMAPAAVAVTRRHHQRIAILALNLLLGWTFLGWVVALVWALTATRDS